MKKLAIITSLISVVSLMNVAHAGNTINFHGEITESTCNSTVAGGNDVTLPTLSTNAFAPAIGSAAGRTQFVINVTGCTLKNDKTKVAAYFDAGSANVDSTTGYLNNTSEGVAGGASGVKLQLIDGVNLTPIKVGYADQVAGTGGNGFNTITGADGAGAANLTYFVEYVRSTADPMTAGAVEGNVVYELMYN